MRLLQIVALQRKIIRNAPCTMTCGREAPEPRGCILSWVRGRLARCFFEESFVVELTNKAKNYLRG